MNLDEKIQELLDRENLKLADTGSRALAWLLDNVLLSLIFTLIHLTTLQNLSDAQGNVDYMMLREFMLENGWQAYCLKIAYDTLFVWLYGASLGKMLFKVRIITLGLVDKPNFIESLLRSFGKFVGEGLFFITYFFAFGDEFRRTLHDRLVKTLAIAC